VTIPGTTGGLPVHGDHTGRDANEACDPLAKTGFKHLGVQQAKYPAKGVVGRCAVFKHQIALQPGFVILRPFGTIHPTVRTTQHSTQRHPNHCRQIVPLCRSRARV
jgi:hypothetical protein